MDLEGETVGAMAKTLIIVADHSGLATALDHLLTDHDWDQVVPADGLDQARSLVLRLRPSLLVVSQEIAGGTTFVTSMLETHPRLPIVVLAGTTSPDDAITALRAGAVAFLPKSSTADELRDAIETAAEGQVWLPRSMVGPVVRSLLDPPPADEWKQLVASLSDREREVLGLMVDGLDRREIADRLIISLNTVRTHVKNILARLGVHSSLEAVSLALHAGLRPRDDAARSAPQPTTVRRS